MLKIFSHLGKPHQWRIAYLVIANIANSLKDQLTDITSDKHVVFWDLNKFKLYFHALLNPKIDYNFPFTRAWKVQKKKDSDLSYNDIFQEIVNSLLHKAIRPNFTPNPYY